ncbi:hypothetical protein OC844_007899, partial [Tilletia horrida]
MSFPQQPGSTSDPVLPYIHSVPENIREDVVRLSSILTSDDSEHDTVAKDDAPGTLRIQDTFVLSQGDNTVLNAAGARSCLGNQWLDDAAVDWLFRLIKGLIRAELGEDIHFTSAVNVTIQLAKTRSADGQERRVTRSTRSNGLSSASITILPVNDAAMKEAPLPGQDGSIGSHWMAAVLIGPNASATLLNKVKKSVLVRPGRWTIAWIDSAPSGDARLSSAAANLIKLVNNQLGSNTVDESDFVPVRCPLQSNSYDCGALVFQNVLAILRGTLNSLHNDEGGDYRGPWARRAVHRLVEGVWDRTRPSRKHKRWAQEMDEEAAQKAKEEGRFVPPRPSLESQDKSVAREKDSTRPSPELVGDEDRPQRTSRSKGDQSGLKDKRIPNSLYRRYVQRDETIKVWYDGADGVSKDDLVRHFKKMPGYRHVQPYRLA